MGWVLALSPFRSEVIPDYNDQDGFAQDIEDTFTPDMLSSHISFGSLAVSAFPGLLFSSSALSLYTAPAPPFRGRVGFIVGQSSVQRVEPLASSSKSDYNQRPAYSSRA